MSRLRTGIVAVLAAVGLVVTAAPAPPARAAGGPNLAAGRNATASSVNGPYVAANLTDGNQGSYWESSGALPQWAQVDLGTRIHRNRDLDDLGPQALVVLQTALDRAGVRYENPATLVRPGRPPYDTTLPP